MIRPCRASLAHQRQPWLSAKPCARIILLQVTSLKFSFGGNLGPAPAMKLVNPAGRQALLEEQPFVPRFDVQLTTHKLLATCPSSTFQYHSRSFEERYLHIETYYILSSITYPCVGSNNDPSIHPSLAPLLTPKCYHCVPALAHQQVSYSDQTTQSSLLCQFPAARATGTAHNHISRPDSYDPVRYSVPRTLVLLCT